MVQADLPDNNNITPSILTEAEFQDQCLGRQSEEGERVLVMSKTGLALFQYRPTNMPEDDKAAPSEARAATAESSWVCLEKIALSGAASRRGDTVDVVTSGDLPVLSVDDTGRILARLAPAPLLQSLLDLSGAPNVDLGERLGITQPIRLYRGDSAGVVSMSGRPLLVAHADGRLAFHPSADTLYNIADGLPLPGGRSEPPDAVSAYDAWGARRDGEMLYFTGIVWGDSPREYVKRKSGEPWAATISDVALRLLYGDELADTPVMVGPDYFAHVFCFNDGAGYEGLGGEPHSEAEADDIERVSSGFEAVAADSNLRSRKGAKPLTGIRNEAVPGANLTDLGNGQALQNLGRAVRQFRSAVRPYGKRAFTETVTLLHGAADDSVNYKSDLLTLASRVVTETGARQINLFQPVGTALEHDPASVFATVEAFRERGNLPLVVVAPLYSAERRSGSLTQPTPEAMTMLAELSGLAGADWLPPMAYYAEREADLINVDFEVMPGYELIAPSYGLKYVDADGFEIPILSSAITKDPVTAEMTRLNIKLEQAPAIGGRFSYAFGNLQPSFDLSGNKFCSGGDLRDNWSCPSVTGQTLYRYALAFEFKV